MAQQSIVNYFNTRKRGAIEDLKINGARKVLLLDKNDSKIAVRSLFEACGKSDNINNNIKRDIPVKTHVVCESETNMVNSPSTMARKKLAAVPRSKKAQAVTKMGNIEQFLSNMTRNKDLETSTIIESGKNETESIENAKPIEEPVTPTRKIPEPVTPTKRNIPEPVTPTKRNIPELVTPTKRLNAMDKVNLKGTEPSLAELKQKLSRSSRLAELKASLARFKRSEKQLKAAEENTKQLKESPALKGFKALELEVNLSPTKPQSPQKQYLSPKKDTSARRNLINLLSPTKNATHMPITTSKETLMPVKESLALPYKYRRLAEIFRAIDTVSQILHNRKETITFKKLKPAVEEMLKRNVAVKHLGQIKSLYPESFALQWEKLREFGTGTRREHWELVVVPQVEQTTMTSELLLQRRRKLYKILIDKLKNYHQEFLMTLDPPMEIPRDKITRWHPLFDIEKVPDIENLDLPQAPTEETFTTGSQVLQKARAMFNCNTRMERALEKLKEARDAPTPVEAVKAGSILKGIPKALLEKVRQKQAAKALESMTRSTVKEKEVQLYSKLPEVARLARNLFVSEKKSVLPLELVVDKLCNSYKVFSTKSEMEMYLKTIAKEVSEWLVFHEIRGAVFLKLTKSADLSLVMTKLQNLVEHKKTN